MRAPGVSLRKRTEMVRRSVTEVSSIIVRTQSQCISLCHRLPHTELHENRGQSHLNLCLTAYYFAQRYDLGGQYENYTYIVNIPHQKSVPPYGYHAARAPG